MPATWRSSSSRERRSTRRRTSASTTSADDRERRAPGVTELVPVHRSLLVYYDPLRTTRAALERALEDVRPVPTPSRRRTDRGFRQMAANSTRPRRGRTREAFSAEVIRIHSNGLPGHMIGFTAGFPYLGGMSPAIATPRLPTPRTRIPAGSVGIAQQQTGIYPADSPGGWQIIGRTPVRIFDPADAGHHQAGTTSGSSRWIGCPTGRTSVRRAVARQSGKSRSADGHRRGGGRRPDDGWDWASWIPALRRSGVRAVDRFALRCEPAGGQRGRQPAE
jgi:allophanate hydrolase subunit 1